MQAFEETKLFFLIHLYPCLLLEHQTSSTPAQLVLLAPKKTDNDVEIVKIVNVFKKIWTIAILMRKDVPNPGKLVWGPYD